MVWLPKVQGCQTKGVFHKQKTFSLNISHKKNVKNQFIFKNNLRGTPPKEHLCRGVIYWLLRECPYLLFPNTPKKFGKLCTKIFCTVACWVGYAISFVSKNKSISADFFFKIVLHQIELLIEIFHSMGKNFKNCIRKYFCIVGLLNWLCNFLCIKK